jgi:hypothetical protein
MNNKILLISAIGVILFIILNNESKETNKLDKGLEPSKEPKSLTKSDNTNKLKEEIKYPKEKTFTENLADLYNYAMFVAL